jgi:predicted transposase YbfD/YdcC
MGGKEGQSQLDLAWEHQLFRKISPIISFHGDESRIKEENAPENIAVLRHIAANMIETQEIIIMICC